MQYGRSEKLIAKALEFDRFRQKLFLSYGRRNEERILKACINTSQQFAMKSPEDVFRAWESPARKVEMPRFDKHNHRRKMSTTDYITNCIKLKKLGL